MALYFVTGSQEKYGEARAILPGIQRLESDLPEIQSLDAQTVIRAKLAEALRLFGARMSDAAFIVEDTSLRLDCLNGLPGPLIKWFLEAVGSAGLHAIAERFGNTGAEACALVGYAECSGKMYFFEGSVRGSLVSPRGSSGFGWDVVFRPDGGRKTFAEMGEEKNRISMRVLALKKLKKFLDAGRGP